MTCDHFLFIGIDAYQGVAPLYGAANDVDAMAQIFQHRLGVSPTNITKLVARHNKPRADERQPTLANIREELEKLTSISVQPGDRVFIHYSGHGTRISFRTSPTAREALVPMDVGTCGDVLFDYEINDILQRIALRTNDVTVVMDCCFAASATRGAFPPSSIRTCRVRSFVSERPAATLAGFSPPASPSDPGYIVVASAQSSETAREVRHASGEWHSAFMAAFLDLFHQSFTEDLRQLRWIDIWPRLRAAISARSPGQHPCLLGRSERRVFGGPFQPGDPGISLFQNGDHVLVDAGSLAGLSVGAEIGVYGPNPPYFEPLGLLTDVHVRLGVLRVEAVNLTSAKAVPLRGPVDLSAGARGRLIKPGPTDRLVVAMDPFDGAVATDLEKKAHVRVVPFGADDVEVVVGRADDGRFWIGDEVFGSDDPLGWTAPRDIRGLARGLMHYARFNVPIRLARRSGEHGELLSLTVLNAAQVKTLRRDEWSNPPLIEANLDAESGCRYCLVSGDEVCFSVWNHSAHTMYVHLLNCASSGAVQLLGTQQVEILAGKHHVFWYGGVMGEPFQANLSSGRTWNVDRLVAVGTVAADVNLASLEVRGSFAEAMGSAERGNELLGAVDVEWVATTVKVRIVCDEKKTNIEVSRRR